MLTMNIKNLRQEAGLSQMDLACRMGVIRSAVANWESEISLPMTRDLPRLARVLGCTISDLFVDSPGSGQASPSA